MNQLFSYSDINVMIPGVVVVVLAVWVIMGGMDKVKSLLSVVKSFLL